MSRPKSIPAIWRDAIGDSELDSTAKLVAYALSTFMDRRGVCWPGRAALAQRTSSGLTTVDRAVARLEKQRWLAVERARGRGRTNTYAALLSKKASERRISEWEKASIEPGKGVAEDGKGPTSDARKLLKRKKAAAPSASALSGASAEPLPDEECEVCHERKALVGPDFHRCATCEELRESDRDHVVVIGTA